MAQVAIANFIISRGEDLDIKLRYKEGADAASASVVDLSTGYSVRMDVVDPFGARLYTFNSANIADADPGITGSQPDNILEGALSSGAGNTPNITVRVARTLTLPGGVLYAEDSTTYMYDIFLRNTSADFQWKVLRGAITVEDSYTLWS